MKVISAVLAPVVLAVFTTGASAQTYDCDMHNQGRDGWVTSRMIFALAPEESTGFVFDGIIKEAHGVPVPARVTKRKDTLWRYRWKVKEAKSSNSGKLNLSYSALLNTKTGKVTLNGILHGSDNQISGEGRCTVVKR